MGRTADSSQFVRQANDGERDWRGDAVLLVTLKRLHQTKLQHPHLINLHPDLHTTDLVKTD